MLSTFAIGLSSCNNKKEIKYLDHSDYGTTLKSNVCTTVMYDNANYYYDICNNLKVKSQFSTFDPFDTSLFIRYSADRLSTQDIVNIETIFGKSISKMHALFDSNYYYLDDDGQTRINNLHMLNSNYGKEEIEIEEALSSRIKIICDFCNTKPEIINGSIRHIKHTNLTYIEPHRIIINEIYIRNLGKKIKLSELENYIKRKFLE